MESMESTWYDSPVYNIVNDLGLNLSLSDIEHGARSAEILCEQPVPVNASSSCQPELAPCLFNIKLDPCEYHNIASLHPVLVESLLMKLDAYNATAVPPRN